MGSARAPPPPPATAVFASHCCRCFFRVNRQEAEQMLEAKPENGGLIVRPSTVVNSYAVTLRLLTPRWPPDADAGAFP